MNPKKNNKNQLIIVTERVTLFDDEKTHKKLRIMGTMDALLIDDRNQLPDDVQAHHEAKTNDFIRLGKSYSIKIVITELNN